MTATAAAVQAQAVLTGPGWELHIHSANEALAYVDFGVDTLSAMLDSVLAPALQVFWSVELVAIEPAREVYVLSRQG